MLVCVCALFCFWIASYCWVGVLANWAGVSGQTAVPAVAGRIAVKMGSARMGVALARLALNSGGSATMTNLIANLRAKVRRVHNHHHSTQWYRC